MYRQIPTLTWAVCLLLATGVASAVPGGPFQPLDSHWPTPDEKRLATGKPGPAYWQQRVNYDIKAELDVSSKRIYGSATLEYFNNSPHALESIWVQLDQNRFDPSSRSARGQSLRKPAEDLTYREWLRLIASPDFQGGVRVTRAAMGELDLKRTLVDTMMRLDLPQPLEPGGRISLSIDWWFPLVDLNRLGGRSGYETLAGGHDIFVLAQWYPRVAAYTDYEGWQHKSFLGTGEFALEFGTFDVALTVPADHLVASTGELQNPNAVLASEQRSRYIRAQRSAEPVMVVNAEEVRSALRKKPSRQKKTWIFRAEGVRDFAMADLARLHLGRHGAEPERQLDHGDVLLPRGRRAVVEQIRLARRRPDVGGVFPPHLRLPLPGVGAGQRPGVRHGVPHDDFHVDTPLPGRLLLGCHPAQDRGEPAVLQVRPDQHHHP